MLGIGASLLTLTANVSSFDRLSTACGRQHAVVARPVSPSIPKLRLVGAARISACETAELEAASSVGRSWFLWGCANDAVLHSALAANATNGSVLSLSGRSLTPGKTYVITAQARTVFGTHSAIQSHSLTLTQVLHSLTLTQVLNQSHSLTLTQVLHPEP